MLLIRRANEIGECPWCDGDLPVQSTVCPHCHQEVTPLYVDPMVDGPDEVARAQRQFDNGHIEAAAWLLSEQRRLAVSANDAARLAEIDEVSATMRTRLKQDDRLAVFDAGLAGRETAAENVSSGYACVLILVALALGCFGFVIGAGLAWNGSLPGPTSPGLLGWALIFGVGLPTLFLCGLFLLGRPQLGSEHAQMMRQQPRNRAEGGKSVLPFPPPGGWQASSTPEPADAAETRAPPP